MKKILLTLFICLFCFETFASDIIYIDDAKEKSEKILKEGDIINVDVTAFKDGWHGDTSRTFKVGAVSIKAENLIKTTYESMMKAINIILGILII